MKYNMILFLLFIRKMWWAKAVLTKIQLYSSLGVGSCIKNAKQKHK